MPVLVRRSVAAVVAVVLIASLVTCTDSTGTSSAGRGRLSFVPVFSASATQATSVYSALALGIDRVRVVVVRPAADTLKDTTVTVPPGGADIVLSLEVRANAGEVLTGGLEFRAGSVVLFSGSAPVTVRALGAPPGSNPPAPIAVIPVAAGANAASVAVSPPSGTFPTGAAITFTASALTAGGAPIPNPWFFWSVDDSTVGTVVATTGVVQPTAKGGTLRVRATTVSGVFGEAVVTLVAPAARVAAPQAGQHNSCN